MARGLRYWVYEEDVPQIRHLLFNGGSNIMIMKFISTAFAAVILLGLAVGTFAQDTVITKKEVVTNPDGSYTVIEYPVGHEVTVNLLPSGTLAGSKGTARVMRTADGTRVVFNVNGLPATGKYYAYAIDPSGVPTVLGPLTIENGVAVGQFQTSLNQFMLALSPMETMTAFEPEHVVFRSEVPTGFTAIPVRQRTAAVVAVGNSAGNQFAYNVPLLNIPAFGADEKTLTIKFPEYDGLEAKITVDREKGATKVIMAMENMKRAPETKRFVLWTYGPDGKYTKLGQVINTGRRDDTKVASETALQDFGLFVTVEDTDVTVPTSQIYQVVKVG